MLAGAISTIPSGTGHKYHRSGPKGQAEVKSPSALAWQHEPSFSEHTFNKCGTNSSSTHTLPGAEQLRAPQGRHRPGRTTERGEEATPTPASSVSLGKGKAQWAVTAAATSLL